MIRVISKLEVVFCVFLAENNFVNALILFSRARPQMQEGCVFDLYESMWYIIYHEDVARNYVTCAPAGRAASGGKFRD